MEQQTRKERIWEAERLRFNIALYEGFLNGTLEKPVWDVDDDGHDYIAGYRGVTFYDVYDRQTFYSRTNDMPNHWRFTDGRSRVASPLAPDISDRDLDIVHDYVADKWAPVQAVINRAKSRIEILDPYDEGKDVDWAPRKDELRRALEHGFYPVWNSAGSEFVVGQCAEREGRMVLVDSNNGRSYDVTGSGARDGETVAVRAFSEFTSTNVAMYDAVMTGNSNLASYPIDPSRMRDLREALLAREDGRLSSGVWSGDQKAVGEALLEFADLSRSEMQLEEFRKAGVALQAFTLTTDGGRDQAKFVDVTLDDAIAWAQSRWSCEKSMVRLVSQRPAEAADIYVELAEPWRTERLMEYGKSLQQGIGI